MPTALPNNVSNDNEAQAQQLSSNNKQHFLNKPSPNLINTDIPQGSASLALNQGDGLPLDHTTNYQENGHDQISLKQESNLKNNENNSINNQMPHVQQNLAPNYPNSRRASVGVYPQIPNSQMNMVTAIPEVPLILSKANLIFEGNFDEIKENWTEEERICKRRLVQFWRRHENNTIYCSFRPISAASRPPNSIVVSCIYWEERMEYFITSVDCIHLLESIISVRFTVEEKNRIRRNLEGFRPLTISKCKKETSEFFKLIMAFPNPKPRNIEKDVKVFHWRVLPFALKKIVSKYASGYNPNANITMDAFNNVNAKIPSNTMSYNPYYNNNTAYSNVRSGYQRRYSQPANMVNMEMFNQYKAMQQNPQGQSYYMSPQGQGLTSQPYRGSGMNVAFNPAYQAMPSISEKPTYEDFNQFAYASHPQTFQPRRHSLADPYSAHQARPRNVNPLERLNEESIYSGHMNQQHNQGMGTPSYSHLRQPAGLGIMEGGYNFNSNKSQDNNDSIVKNDQN